MAKKSIPAARVSLKRTLEDDSFILGLADRGISLCIGDTEEEGNVEGHVARLMET